VKYSAEMQMQRNTQKNGSFELHQNSSHITNITSVFSDISGVHVIRFSNVRSLTRIFTTHFKELATLR